MLCTEKKMANISGKKLSKEVSVVTFKIVSHSEHSDGILKRMTMADSG